MERSFRDLPLSKRYKLLQPQEESNSEPSVSLTAPCLPAKKRLDSHHQPTAAAAATTTYCLPAKKRVWAPHPLSPIKPQDPLSPIKPQDDTKGDCDELPNGEEQEEDGIVCAVCRSTDGDPINPIVICDGCELMVHAECYGNPLIQSIPDGDWFCFPCEKKKKTTKDDGFDQEIRCCLCPVKGGALKPTVDGGWAHIVCSLLVPEVFFRDPEGRDGIDRSLVPAAGRRKRACYLCGTKYGCVIECSEPKCELAFHATCGLEEGLSIEYKDGKKGGIVAGFCKDHTQLWEKQQRTGKFKIVPRDADSKGKI